MLDINAYTTEINVSVHVGALHLITATQSQLQSQSQSQSQSQLQPQPQSQLQPQPQPQLQLQSQPVMNVSVLLPVYNGEKYLEQCLYSILLTPQHCGKRAPFDYP